MNFTSFLENGRLTVALTGEIDHHCAKKYILAITAKIEAYTPDLCVLDFRDVTFMDSSGIALIVKTGRMMKELGGRAWIENPATQPRRVIDASGIDRLIPVAAGKQVCRGK